MIMPSEPDVKGKRNETPKVSRKKRREFKRMLRKAEKKARRLNAQGQAPGSYEFIPDDEQLTGYAGMFLVKEMLAQLEVVDKLRELVRMRKRKSKYSSEQLSYLLLEQKLMGIAAVEASEVLRHDAPYKDLHDLESYPCAQTFRDHLHRFTMENVEQLAQLSAAILDLFALMTGPHAVNLLIDSKVVTVYGDQEGAEVGYNPHKRGRKSYCLKICCIEDMSQPVVNIELCPGAEVSATDFVGFFADCERNLPANWTIKEVKLDRGYYSEAIIEHLEEKRLLYTIAAKQIGRLKHLAHKRADGWWRNSVGQQPRIIDLQYKPTTWKKERRFIIAKIFTGDKVIATQQGTVIQPYLFEELRWRTQALVTNRTADARQCYAGYNARALVENVLKELTYGYHAFRQPSASATANTANAVLGALAYNVMTLAKHWFFPESYKNKSLEIVRRRLIIVPARIVGVVKKRIHLPKDFPYAGVMQQIQRVIEMNFIRRFAFG